MTIEILKVPHRGFYPKQALPLGKRECEELFGFEEEYLFNSLTIYT